MNEKSYLNEVVFIFAVQLWFWKILNFFDPDASLAGLGMWVWKTGAHVSGMVVRPRRLGLDLSDLGPDLSDLGPITISNLRAWVWQACETVFGYDTHARPKHIGSDKNVWFDKQQTKRIIVHFSYREREKKEKTQTINHWLQFNHYLSTRATPCERVHECTSN